MDEVDEKSNSDNVILIAEELSQKSYPRRWILMSLLFHLFCTILFTAAWKVIPHLFGKSRPYGVNLISSPAREAITYEAVLFMNNLGDWNAYKGEPSPELDRAWDEILKYRNLAIPSTHLPKHLDSLPILTPNGTSTNTLLINLDVFHNLHCLNTIREYIFRSYYSKSSPNLEHINHCVDSIRQALQCHADISIGTYSWKENHHIPWPNFRIVHECRNWDAVLEWAKKNDAGVLKGRLVHPVLGII